MLRKDIGTSLPTQALAVKKIYKNGKPNRAKYRIVVLGNLNKHNLTKNDCFASVTSQLEFKLLIALSVHLKLEPK